MNDQPNTGPSDEHRPTDDGKSESTLTSDETLARLALGELDARAEAEARAQIDRSPETRTRFEAIASAVRGLSQARAAGAAFEVSGAVVRRLADATRPTVAGSSSGLLAHLGERIATIVFDSLRAPALAGVRGSGQPRLVKIETDGVEIDLRIDRDETREMSVVAGEVRAENVPLRFALRRLDTGQERSIGVGTDGFFDFETPSGTYALRLQWAEADSVAVDAIEL